MNVAVVFRAARPGPLALDKGATGLAYGLPAMAIGQESGHRDREGLAVIGREENPRFAVADQFPVPPTSEATRSLPWAMASRGFKGVTSSVRRMGLRG